MPSRAFPLPSGIPAFIPTTLSPNRVSRLHVRHAQTSFQRKGSTRCDRAPDRRRIVLMLLLGGVIDAVLLYLCLTKSG